MMSKMDLVRKYFDAAWVNPPASIVQAAEKYLSNNFRNLDKDGNVVQDKAAWIGMSQLLFSAFTDFEYKLSGLHEEVDGVIESGHFEGTHTGDLDLSAMGLGVISATGKKIVWPEASSKWRVAGEKIISIEPYGDSGGVEAFMEALGVKIPTA